MTASNPLDRANPHTVLATPTEPGNTTIIAPLWHTTVLTLILLGISAAGALHLSRGLFSSEWIREGRYLTGIVFQWLLVLFVLFGIRHHGLTLKDLIAGRWPTWRAVISDLCIAIVFLFVILLVLGYVKYALNMERRPNFLVALFPRTPLENITWCFSALTAGFCEEVIFRGYFMRQLTALTKSRPGGILLQGILFGISHGYQGLSYMALIATEGCILGAFAYWRHSLRPGIIAHTLQDGIIGFVGAALIRSRALGH
jgi:membrane protease YdiL (CAAX protease family)